MAKRGGDPVTGRPPLSPAAVLVAALAVIALCFALGAIPQVFTGEDARYSLAWAADLFRLEQPEVDGPVPAKHPLLLAAGLLLAPFGAGATYLTFEAFAIGTWLLLGLGAFRFARALGGPLAGVIAAVIVMAAPETFEQLLNTNKDILFVALVLLAGAIAVEEGTFRPLPVLGLLALAGLIRPEAWLLAGAFWLWLLLENRRDALDPRPVALLLIAPVLWVATDLVLTGDPLHTLHHGQDKVAEIKAAGFEDSRTPRSGPGAVEKLRDGLDAGFPGQVGWGVLIAALLVFGGRLLASLGEGPGRPSLGRYTVPAAIVLATVAGAALVAAAGLSLPGRFLLLAAFVCVCVAASAVPRAARSPLAAAATLILAAGTALALPNVADDYERVVAQRDSTREAADQLRELAQRPEVVATIEECPLIGFGGSNRARVSLGRATAAIELDVPVRAMPPGRDPLLIPGAAGRSAFAWGPVRPSPATVLRSGNWRFVSDCAEAAGGP